MYSQWTRSSSEGQAFLLDGEHKVNMTFSGGETLLSWQQWAPEAGKVWERRKGRRDGFFRALPWWVRVGGEAGVKGQASSVRSARSAVEDADRVGARWRTTYIVISLLNAHKGACMGD